MYIKLKTVRMAQVVMPTEMHAWDEGLLKIDSTS